LHITVSKLTRQALIRKILEQAPARSQDELRKKLARKGARANQATISRDIRELGAIKTASGYALPGTPPPRITVSLDHIYNIDVAGNLVILRTPPGLASPTAIELDRAGHPDLLGTVAGDDTIFVAARSAAAAAKIAKQLSKGTLA
jgi:transcriptional regulator of arginine metabolism